MRAELDAFIGSHIRGLNGMELVLDTYRIFHEH